MKLKHIYKIVVLLIVTGFSVSCSNNVDVTPQLSVSATTVTLEPEGGTSQDITIEANSTWIISNPAYSWLQLSTTSGKSGSTVIHLTTLSPNGTGATQSAVLIISSSNGQSRRVKVSQAPAIYPSYNTSPISPDSTGMTLTAVQQAANMKLGINLGNTFESPGDETGWGSPVITESYIQYLKQKGFNSIRIPCNWDWSHIVNKKTEQIDPNWLARVKEVVGYCTKNHMYVLLNIHWDGGWLEPNCTLVKKDSVNGKQKALWEQIATTMRDFDEHLMFASSNEPNANDAVQMSVLQTYHQTFVNAVRSTGGRNTYRILVVQGAHQLMNVFPTDPTPHRIMYEEHNYDPFTFTELSTVVSWGSPLYYWGTGHLSTIEPGRNDTTDHEADKTKYFQELKAQFIDKGIPVLLGEYGITRRSEPLDQVTHQASVDYWITFSTKTMLTYGIKPFYWEVPGSASVFNRQNNTITDQRTYDAIMAGAL